MNRIAVVYRSATGTSEVLSKSIATGIREPPPTPELELSRHIEANGHALVAADTFGAGYITAPVG